jgi:hypothetical protein
VTRGSVALAFALTLVLAAPARAQLLSLFPERSARDRQAALDGLDTWHPRVVLGRWRPYGLEAQVQELELSAAPGGLELDVLATRQDWGPLGAWTLRAGALRRLSKGLALGLSWRGERVDGGRGATALQLDAALGERPRCVLSTRLLASHGGALRSPAAQLGLSVAESGWILRLWRNQSGPEGVEEGLALERALGPLALGLEGQWPGWQALALRVDAGRVALRLEERLHPALGTSHGLRLLLR